MLKKIVLFVLAIFSSFNIYSECSLIDLTIITSDCNEQNLLTATINFNHSETSDSFTVKGNGLNYGTFSYDKLPLDLELEGNCTTVYEFVIADQSNASCMAVKEVGKICCTDACEIKIKDLEVESCDESNIELSFNLEKKGTGDNGFDVFSRHNFVGFYKYSDLPVTINDFPSSNSATERLIVCENDNTTCCDTIIFETPCGCAFNDIEAEIIDCNEQTENFFVKLNLQPQMTSDSFIVGGNNTNYGTFAYKDLPITIGPLPFSETKGYEFLFVDRFSSFCFDFVDIGVVKNCDVPCKIENLKVELGECSEEKTFIADLTFNHSGTVSDSFFIKGNGKNYGTFPYGEEFYRLGPLMGDCETLYEFVVIDQNNSDCQNFVDLDEKVCCQEKCPIKKIEAELSCEDRKLTITLITENATSGDSVSIFLSDKEIKRVTYADFPYIVELPMDQTYPIKILIKDLKKPDCKEDLTIEKECSNCKIKELNVDFLECNESKQLFFKINFDHEQAEDAKFKLFIQEFLFETFSYSELPVTIGPIENIEGGLIFDVLDAEVEGCKARKKLNAINCTSSTDELKKVGVSYFLHPQKLEITNTDSEINSYMLTRMDGKKIIHSQLKSQNSFNTESLASGIYFLSFIGHQKMITEKIFIGR